MIKFANVIDYDKDMDKNTPIFQPFYKPDYNLMISSQQYFIFFKYFYTIYERIIKAQ